LVLFYSQGYRFDFDEKKFVGTGGLYIQVSNTSAEIYLNGKFIRKTGFLSNAALIKNLLPKKHDIEIRKIDFWSWEKSLSIEEKKVTKIENVLLIKKGIPFSVLTQNLEDFLVSQDEKKILLKKTTEEKNWFLEELLLENGVKRKILTEEDLVKLTQSPAEITDWKWDSSKNGVLLQITSGEEISYFLLDYIPQTPVLSKIDFLDEKTENISFNPKSDDEFFYLKDQVMFKRDLGNKEHAEQTFLNNLVTFKTTEDNIIWLSTSGFLFKTDYFGQMIEVLNQKPFFIQKEKKYKIEIQNSELFLSENDDLYYLSSEGTLEKIVEGVQGMKFSPDSKKAVYWNNHEIWILEFGSEYKKVFLTRFSKKIGDCFWLTPYYLIFNVEEEIKISEIDNRDKLNIINLSNESLIRNEENLRIFYNELNKKLYILNQEILFSSEPIIP
jgi:hypothetical protein